MISKRLTRLDLLFIALAVVAAVLLFAVRLIPTADRCVLHVISEGGEQTYSLEESREIELVSRGIALRIKIENGGAYILSSECPNGICMASPVADRAGDSIVCAPAGVALIVYGTGGDSGADAFAG